MVDKQALIAEVVKILEEELNSIRLSIQNAEGDLRDAPGANKSHSDSTKSQKEGLLVGFTKQLADKKASLMQLKRLAAVVAPSKVVVGSLVEVEGKRSGKRCLYFIVPGGGGKRVNIAGLNISIIPPNSPIALGLFGHKAGDDAECEIPNGVAKLKIITIE